MARLIDADALKACYEGGNGLDDKASYESVRKMIDIQPTIIDNLEQLEKDIWNSGHAVGYVKGYDDGYAAGITQSN